MTLDLLSQAVITVCGVTAIWLSQEAEESRRRWACIFGLAAQPAWAFTTIHAGQYGITALCLLYGYSWFKGFRLYWIKSYPQKTTF